jgi:hypothetical protein
MGRCELDRDRRPQISDVVGRMPVAYLSARMQENDQHRER